MIDDDERQKSEIKAQFDKFIDDAVAMFKQDPTKVQVSQQ